MGSDIDAGGWLTDLLLQREGLRARAGGAPVPHDFAGLVINDEEVSWLLSDDGGGSGPDAITTEFDAAIAEARRLLRVECDLATTASGRLARRLDLSDTESEVLAVLVAIERSGRRQRLVAFVQNNVSQTRLTLGLLDRLFADVGMAAVAPDAILRRACLVTIEDDGAWSNARLAVPTAVGWAMAGHLGDEPNLPADLRRFVVESRTGDGTTRPTLVLVHGPDAARRRAVAGQVLGASRLLACGPPSSPDAWEALVRHATLAGDAVILELEDIADDARVWIERATHLPWALSSPDELPLLGLPHRPWDEVQAGAGPATDAEWLDAVGEPSRDGLRLMPTQLELLGRAGGHGDVAAAVRRLASGELRSLTRRIRPRRGWNDLVLPHSQTEALKDMCDRYAGRTTVYDTWGFTAVPSAGITAVFAGSSGTGKTLAAEVVAGVLGLDLYTLDLASVVSKYIGETEKNLDRVFAAAATGDVVLFFDEADALFGKRSEVSDAHDRYANLEVAYLLQRLEAHDGLVVLASNLQHNIDAAFLRRIHVLVDFPMPEEDQRREIWRLAFPPRAPVHDLDIDFLARQFKITGGAIRNVALHAAFLAASRDQAITMELVVHGVKRELRKLGRLCTESEFGRWWPAVEGDARASTAG